MSIKSNLTLFIVLALTSQVLVKLTFGGIPEHQLLTVKQNFSTIVRKTTNAGIIGDNSGSPTPPPSSATITYTIVFDGCKKNCLDCERTETPDPKNPNNINVIKSCLFCYFSAPKKIDDTKYDCSGPTISNCEYGVSLLTETYNPSCLSCRGGFYLDKNNSCKKMDSDWKGCEYGDEVDLCGSCQVGYGHSSTDPSKNCTSVPSENKIDSCVSYVYGKDTNNNTIYGCELCQFGFITDTSIAPTLCMPASDVQKACAVDSSTGLSTYVRNYG
jgi:hypothetical protein